MGGNLPPLSDFPARPQIHARGNGSGRMKEEERKRVMRCDFITRFLIIVAVVTMEIFELNLTINEYLYE